MPRKASLASPTRSSPSPKRKASPKRSPSPKRQRSPKVTATTPVAKVTETKDVITTVATSVAEVLSGGPEGQNVKLIESQKVEERLKLAPGETNWFEILTSMSFIWRLLLVVAVMTVCAIIILNITLNPNSKSWYNQLHKLDWSPDGITIVVIFAFLSFLLAWCWFRFSQFCNPTFINTLFIIILALQFSWTLCLFRVESLEAGRYLSCFFLGFMSILFIFSLWYFGFSDVTLYTLLYVGWLIIIVCFTFGLHELDKEYKILGLVKDKKSSLYKKKMKMEIVQGIKIDESGLKHEFIPDEQE
jgi:tryptophan-rich sensory protein